MGIDIREYRDALGRFATGVTVITTANGDGQLFGLTANSFTSLSLDPPLVLFCLDNNAQSFEAFNDACHFAVNILSEKQQHLSSRFAKSGPEKWEGVAFDAGHTGSPILPGSLACMECKVSSISEGGDHVIVIGEVLRMERTQEDVMPLLYYRGGYANLSS